MRAERSVSAGGHRLVVRDSPASDWDGFVAQFPGASLYHLAGWAQIARQVFGHRALFVEAREPSGALVGVLPVIQQRSRLLGNFATSLAFFNYGGPLADDPQLAVQLMMRAAEEAEALGCKYLELRDVQPRSVDWPMRTDKITLQLDLPDSFEALSKRLGAKLRSQVKRADREGVRCRTGSAELLDDFYAVFAENMRDLGTPVYPKRFFAAILERFAAYCQLVVIDWQGEPAAAAFLTFWRARAEVPWASCRAKAKPLGLNMKLYWELLSLSVARGCTSFDFGRSTVDSGTYRFKRQWGAEPKPLYWYRWERGSHGIEVAHGEGKGRVMQVATAVWQRLPLGVANALGPLISGALPW
jgi:FemAB-related protein (PEP-CTERM system-associated)